MKLLTCKINNWIFKGQKLSPLNVSRPTRAKKKAEVICFFFVRLRSKYKVKSQKGSSDAAITLFQHKAWHPSNSLSSCYFGIITNANKINSGLTAPLLRFFFLFFVSMTSSRRRSIVQVNKFLPSRLSSQFRLHGYSRSGVCVRLRCSKRSNFLDFALGLIQSFSGNINAIA